MKRAAALFIILFLLVPHVPVLADKPIYARLTVPFFCLSEIPADMDMIEAELNRITREKIGAEVDLVPLLSLIRSNPDARRQAELNLLEREGISFDLLVDELLDYSGEAIPLDELLNAYGQDIITVVGEDRLNDYRIDGVLYALPSVSDYVTSQGISMRKDILEKYGIDVSQVRSAADLWPVFETVHENEPAMGVVCGYYTKSAVLSFQANAEVICDTVFSLSETDPGTLVCYYATDSFREQAELVHAWYEEGFVAFGMSFQNINASSLVRAGELFSLITVYKPGIEQEVSNSCGMEMVTIPLMEPVVSNYSYSLRHWGISRSCVNPGKAMQFLNLLYSDSEVVNLLSYGLEGVHYVFRDDGTIGYPQGTTAQTVGFANSMPWLLPNQSISYVWERYDADLWEQLEAYNRSAQHSPLVGFIFDDTLVAAENAALMDIKNQYVYGLTSGQLDPDIYLPQMLAEMEATGLERVLAEAQRQYDQWRTAREELS